MISQRAMTSIRVPSAVTDPSMIPMTWLNLPRTPRQADRQGLPWYFSARKCVNGHYSVRVVGKSECPQCARDRAREEQARLRARHPATGIGE